MTHSQSLTNRLFWWVPFGKVPEIAPTELAEKMNNPAFCPQLLDVRSHKEWKNGHLSGAVSIPITQLRSKIDTLSFSQEKPVVTICLSAHRSIPAVRLLQRHGYQNVVQLAGGMNAWRHLKLPEQMGGVIRCRGNPLWLP